jgi:predicted kinase
MDWENRLVSFDVVIMCGLPGSGKSFLARWIAARLSAVVCSSDEIRTQKYLEDGEGKYYHDNAKYEKFRARVYDELHEQVVRHVEDGVRVVVDATYLGPQRDELVWKLKLMGLVERAVFVVVTSDEGVIRKRKEAMSEAEAEQEDVAGWERAYRWFVERLGSGEIRYPHEQLDGIKVIEVNNG